MLQFNSILIGSDNPKALGEFYKKIFAVKAVWEDGDWITFKLGSGSISIGPHSEVKGKSKEPQRILINLETTEVQEEFERIEKLGAKVIAKPYQPGEVQDMWIATFADPDGNYFQLNTPFEDMDVN